MSANAIDLLSAATNLSTAASGLAAAETNLNIASTTISNFATNSIGTPNEGLLSLDSFTILLLMGTGVVVGAFGSFCYQRHALPAEKFRDKWELPKILGMGVAAVALVPAFLRTISSNLIQEAETNLESKFVFVAFCVAATLAAKKFIGTLPEKLLDVANRAAEQAAEAKSDVRKVADVVAQRTPPNLKEPEPGNSQSNIDNPVTGYNWKELRLIRALLDPKYSIGRSVTGLALDSGLTPTEIQGFLQKFQSNGVVDRFIGQASKGIRWHLTRSGREKVSFLKPEAGTDVIADVGIE